ncbi:ABC transporter ATP-binding protein [Candidatus Haliotispira prima]|uniref:ABC transporter ATP-binding protein n=1 Tax=Candidatus Haliotispira prima TaxID=3034016 RepID=A0ABY8MIS8_9SPIO|nr:ABC transporter ATP-binding protein [Candidatus Haliotispira prima]
MSNEDEKTCNPDRPEGPKAPTNALIEVHGLCKSYLSGTERIEILKDVDLTIPRAVSLALLGQSGSGKSTFLNLLGGLDRPDSGDIFCAGENLNQHSEARLTVYRQKFVGFIFQHHYMLKDLTALENVMLPARIAGKSRGKSEKRATELLHAVGLGDRKKHLPHMLSGGERQRIAVVRALMNEPQFVLADEPTGSLDKENALIVAMLLFSLCRDFGTTMILVTHDPSLSAMADLQYSLENMRLLFKQDRCREPSTTKSETESSESPTREP